LELVNDNGDDKHGHDSSSLRVIALTPADCPFESPY
jgi:hypothetical protein